VACGKGQGIQLNRDAGAVPTRHDLQATSL
jgi:hypothetical protein